MYNFLCVAVEQVKGSSDLRQRIITAAREMRKNKDYPIELSSHDCPYITEKYNDHNNKILPTHAAYRSLDRKYST